MKPQSSEINYRALFENMLDGLAYCQMVFDNEKRPIDFVFLETSDNFEKITGLKEVVGKNATDVIPHIKSDNPELFEVFGLVSLTSSPERFEIYLKAPDKWFLISAYSSKQEYFTAIFQNITDRKQAEKRLQDAKIAAHNVFSDLNTEKIKLDEEKAKEEAILSSIAEGIVAIDKSGKIILMNETAENMLGYTSPESTGKMWYEILHREDEKGNPILPEQGAIHAALSTTATTTANSCYYIKKDGTKFPVSRTVSPIVLQGKVIGAIDIFRDISHEKEIDRAKTEFVSLASHQLRTPLTGIEWLVELFLKKEKLTKKGKEYLNDIRFSVHRSSELIKLLLNTSRIENGSVGVHPAYIDLIAFIEKHLKDYKRLCEKKKLSLRFSQHPDKLTAITDMNLIEYILQNLVTNAIDYTPAGGKIDVILEKKTNSILLQVKDTGIGVPKNEQAGIFEKFVRASNSIVAKTDGTGLGLYIAREAAKLLGGKIWFQSPTLVLKSSSGKQEQKGSTFYFEIPLVSPSRAGVSKLTFTNNYIK